jgi:hypothetical protein
MGIGFVARGNNIYDGDYVVAEGKVIENGMFVELTTSADAKTAAPCGASPASVPVFVVNVNENDEVEAVNTEDVKFEAGKAVRWHRVLPGEMIVTSMFEGELAVGAACVPGEGGKLVAGAEGKQNFVVKIVDVQGGVDVVYAEAQN